MEWEKYLETIYLPRGSIQEYTHTRMWRKGNTCALLVGMYLGIAIMKASRGLPPKLKIELPHDLVIPLLGVYPKERIPKKMKTLY